MVYRIEKIMQYPLQPQQVRTLTKHFAYTLWCLRNHSTDSFFQV